MNESNLCERKALLEREVTGQGGKGRGGEGGRKGRMDGERDGKGGRRGGGIIKNRRENGR